MRGHARVAAVAPVAPAKKETFKDVSEVSHDALVLKWTANDGAVTSHSTHAN